jgi:cell wall-associated protease
MKNSKAIYCSIMFSFLSYCALHAQTGTSFNSKKGKLSDIELKRWSHLDIQKDSVPGMSVDKAYAQFLKKKKGTPVIVGVIDSGVDIEHKDLKSVVWVNKKEIPNNGKDDDKNGYIDDVNGWNFIGNTIKEKLEYERIAADPTWADAATYAAAKKFDDSKKAEANVGKVQMQQMIAGVTDADKIMIRATGKQTYTIEDLEKVSSQDQEVLRSKNIMTQMLSYGMPVPELLKEMQKEYDGYMKKSENANKVDTTDYRKIVGDNPRDISQKVYGDNKVMGPDKTKESIKHGTHVAGIIAQTRNNKLGGDGIANNVKIMAIRAVPDGDEYDKDIALSIRYAVDNGAKVINGSFGKSFSPQKQWVYDAIKYAESKDVLIVHAAGNDAKDIDVEDNFPNDSDNKIQEFADNMLTVGALNYKIDTMVASFSNYGHLNVDVFAPGVQIYASVPNNEYDFLQGTSMASPNVAGVAALIRSNYPKLSASQVKHIIMDSGTEITMDVPTGGRSDDKRPFSTLSASGKIVNAYNALQMAEKMSKTLKLKAPLKN